MTNVLQNWKQKTSTIENPLNCSFTNEKVNGLISALHFDMTEKPSMYACDGDNNENTTKTTSGTFSLKTDKIRKAAGSNKMKM